MHRQIAWSVARFSLIALLLVLLDSGTRSLADTTVENSRFELARQIGVDLYDALPSQYQQQICRQPVTLDTNVIPFVKVIDLPNSPSRRLVVVSIGFLDLINNFSHAKAIDRTEPGYFQRYIAQLAQMASGMTGRELPDISCHKYWSVVIINEKESCFNQMLAGVVAIKLSHPSLDHTRDAQETTSFLTPVNQSLALTQWENSIHIGIQSALDCGYGIEGLQTLYDAIDLMPRRPAWVGDLLPDSAKVSRLKSQLAKQERVFFHGR